MSINHNWIQNARNPKKKGALHRQLGLRPTEHIPNSLLESVIRVPVGRKVRGRTVTPLMKKRANFVFNIRK